MTTITEEKKVNIDKQTLLRALREYFGFHSFKGKQEEAIRALLEGNDVFVLMPTGGGKSLCYQLPALLMDGTAIIISPLIALMKNQVDLFRSFMAKDSFAHFLNSSLSASQRRKVLEDLESGRTKLLYIAPETLGKEETLNFLKNIKISFVAVDEAHCISEWGHDFRPDYRNIRPMIDSLEQGRIPIMALTATATPKVRLDIVKNLGMKDPVFVIDSFNRPNLYYEVRQRPSKEQLIKQVIQIIREHEGQQGIVYCLLRKTTEEVAEILQANGIKAEAYHAG
ncbi:MAG: ATP-dependent DNA helicase RecQ, partial [Chlorobi bacterium]|nr:ATP-dependent DNA helicase RecQ [Chlorobiota bacterium]